MCSLWRWEQCCWFVFQSAFNEGVFFCVSVCAMAVAHIGWLLECIKKSAGKLQEKQRGIAGTNRLQKLQISPTNCYRDGCCWIADRDEHWTDSCRPVMLLTSTDVPSESVSSRSSLDPHLSWQTECCDHVKDYCVQLSSLGWQLTLLVEERKKAGTSYVQVKYIWVLTRCCWLGEGDQKIAALCKAWERVT